MQQASERRATQHRFEPLAGELRRCRARGRGDNQDGLPELEPRPGERQADGSFAGLRRRPQADDPTAAAGHVEYFALPGICNPRLAASRPGRNLKRPIRPGGVPSPGFGAFFAGRRVSAISPAPRFLALNRRARSAPCFRRSVSVIMLLRQAHNGI